MTRPPFLPPRSSPCALARMLLAMTVALMLLLAACGGAIAPTATPAMTATNGATGTGRGFIATLIPLTETPPTAAPPMGTRAPLNTMTGAPGGGVTVFPRGTASSITTGTVSSAPQTWTDPDGTLSLHYPGTWHGTPAATPSDDDLRLDGPNNETMFIDIFAPDSMGAAPSVDQALQLIRAAQGRSTQYTYTYGMIQDVMIGGQPAKYLEYQYTPRANQTANPAKGAIWAVQHGDRTVVLRASNIGASRVDVDAIIGSVTFPPLPAGMPPVASSAGSGTMATAPAGTRAATGGTGTSAPAMTTSPAPASTGAAAGGTSPASPAAGTAQAGPGTFTDPNGRMVFQFPRGWKLINPGGASSSFFEFDGPDGALLFVGINDSPGTLDDALSRYRESQQKSQIFTYTETGVMDVQIGGEPGKLLTYTYASQSQPNDPPRDGAVWITVRSAKQFTFDAQNLGTHRPDIDAMVATIRFTK